MKYTVAELRILEQAATTGPWKLWGMTVMDDPTGTSDVDKCREIAQTSDPDRGLRVHNANFIIAARNALPDLLDLLEEARELASALMKDDWMRGRTTPVTIQARAFLDKLRKET